MVLRLLIKNIYIQKLDRRRSGTLEQFESE